VSNHQDIDARIIGSWMKLVNNSFGDMVNCYSRLVYSPDEQTNKIVLIAQRDIEKDEELFFDYGYSEEKKLQISWMQFFIDKYLLRKKNKNDVETVKQAPKPL
jgi:SET domain-containing protein